MLDRMFPTKDTSSTAETADGNEQPSTSTSHDKGQIQSPKPKELAEIVYMKNLYMKSTLAALRVLKEIRSGSSTVSVFSLPPLQVGGLEETWNKLAVMEQVAE